MSRIQIKNDLVFKYTQYASTHKSHKLNMNASINQVIIEEFLHKQFDNFIYAINNYMGLDMYSYTEDNQDWFWDNYEAFAFFNYVFNPHTTFNDIDIICQINDDYHRGIINIHNNTYINYEYLTEYALHQYCLNREKNRNDLINYVDTTITLK